MPALRARRVKVGAATAAGLVPDTVQVRGDRADADVQLGGVWALVRPWATRVTSSRSRVLSFPGHRAGAGVGSGAVSMRAYSAAA
jgi:hypothetical protein